jgi:hypothetical protein
LAKAALRVQDQDVPVIRLLAYKIIALAKGGELNPDLLCERALAGIAQPPP